MEDSKIALKLEEETKNLGKIAEKLEDTIKYEFDKGIEQIDTAEMKEAIDMLKDVYEAKEKLVKSCFYAYTLEAMEKEEEKDEDGEEEEDDGRRGYRGQPRSASGRFMSRGDGRRSNRGGRGRGRRGYEDPMMMYDDDEDWEEMERMRDFDRSSGKMYYSGSGSSGGMSGGQSSGGMSGGSQGGQGGSSYGGGNRGYSESRYENAKRGYQEAKSKSNSGSVEDKQMTMKEAEKMATVIFDELEESLSDAPKEVKDMIKNKGMAKLQKL